MSSMSFSETYMLASRVRLKLTRSAANPKLPLRLLVLQANMLDNLMDHISSQYETRKSSSNKVSFAVDEAPRKRNVSVLRGRGPTVTEYEVESDSDLDLDSDSDLDLDAAFSDSDSDYDSDEEEEEDEDADDYYYHTATAVDVVEEIDAAVILSSSALSSSRANYKPQLQSTPRSQPRVLGLPVIMEDQNEDGLPALTRLTSISSDEEDEEENSFFTSVATMPASYKITSEDLLRKNGLRDIEEPARHHQRHDSVYSIEAVF